MSVPAGRHPAGHVPRLRVHDHGGRGPLLVLGPSLGVGARALWGAAAEHLVAHHHVLSWDLPGHDGADPEPVADVGTLAAAVVDLVDRAVDVAPGEPFSYAGVSLGGAVGLRLALDSPGRLRSLVALCTGAVVGTPEGWRARAEQVDEGGTTTLVGGAAGRWLSPATAARSPQVVDALLEALRATDDASYAALCRALAGHDVTARLPEVAVPVLAVAGDEDRVTPPSLLRALAAGVQDGTAVVLPGVAHLAPLEAPELVASLVVEHLRREPAAGTTTAALRAEGMRTRREVLGDSHVDRTLEQGSRLTADFQDHITTVAWGSVWGRPGLGRRERSVATLAALVAGGHLEELALHLRAALRNGLTRDEVVEVLLHCSVYCGVPAANSAFRVAAEVLGEDAAGPGGRP